MQKFILSLIAKAEENESYIYHATVGLLSTRSSLGGTRTFLSEDDLISALTILYPKEDEFIKHVLGSLKNDHKYEFMRLLTQEQAYEFGYPKPKASMGVVRSSELA